jgi:Spx/MgsR family transcriptional regulator
MPKAKPAATSKTKLQFLQKPSCTTCRKAKAFLEGCGAILELRSLDEQPLSEAELEELIGRRDYILFLSARNELYRSRKMNEHPPARQEAIQLMARNPNLIRRPVVIRGKRVVLGYHEDAFLDLLK